MHPVSDIDIDVFEIAGDLGMHVDDLVRLKLAGQAEDVGYVAALHGAHRGGRMRPPIGIGRLPLLILAPRRGKDQGDGSREGKDPLPIALLSHS